MGHDAEVLEAAGSLAYVPAVDGVAYGVDVTDYVETAVASLCEHRRYLELLSDTPIEEQARQIIEFTPPGEDGRRRIGFKLYWG